MARAGLPKKYARMGFKKGWKEYKKTKRTTTRKTTRTSPKKTKRVYHTKKSKILTKPFMDGLMSGGGKIVMRKVLGSHPIYEAGLDIGIGLARNNKTLVAQGIVNGLTALLPNLNVLGGQGQESWVGQ